MESDSFFEKAGEWDTPQRIEMANVFIREMKKNVSIDPNNELLEFGCGTGLVGLNFFQNVRSIKMVDSSPAMLSVLKEKIRLNNISNIEIFEGDIRDYICPPVDGIFSSMAFHHVDNIEKVLEYFYKLLKKGGFVIIGDLVKEDGSFHGPEVVPHNGFNVNELKKMFEEKDFKIMNEYTYNKIKKTIAGGETKEFEQFILFAKKI